MPKWRLLAWSWKVATQKTSLCYCTRYFLLYPLHSAAQRRAAVHDAGSHHSAAPFACIVPTLCDRYQVTLGCAVEIFLANIVDVLQRQDKLGRNPLGAIDLNLHDVGPILGTPTKASDVYDSCRFLPLLLILPQMYSYNLYNGRFLSSTTNRRPRPQTTAKTATTATTATTAPSPCPCAKVPPPPRCQCITWCPPLTPPPGRCCCCQVPRNAWFYPWRP